MPVAEFASLSYRFPHAMADALRDLSWATDEGMVTLVVGPSGSGKSTFLRCLNGLIPHFHGGSFGGSAHVLGVDTRRAAPRDLARAVGMVFQDPEAQFVTQRVEDEIVFGMENVGVEPRRMRLRLEETLDLLGVHHLRHRDVSTLSGGERQRVAIAAALAPGPRLLVLDEPTSQLDPLAALDVLHAVERLNADLGMTVVLAEHRLERVLPFAERIVSMSVGGFQEGPTRAMLATLDDVPSLIAWARHAGWEPIPLTVRDARRHLPGELPTPRLATHGCSPGAELLRVEGLTFRYGNDIALRDVSFSGHAGEVIALIGRNGSGKTTLLKHINGLLRPTRGRVLLRGVDAARRPTHELARDAGYVPQHPASVLHQETLRAELAFTIRAHGRTDIDAAPLLARLGLTELVERHPLDLSGGERQRGALAALAVTTPPVLLLDEPTRGLPSADKRMLAAFARDYAAAGRLVIVATHDVEFVAEAADRVLLLADGELLADGAPRAVLAGSLAFSTQLNRLFGGDVLTLADALTAATADGRSPVKPTLPA